MEKMKVEISTFVNPHIFFLVEADTKSRTGKISEISSKIKSCHSEVPGNNDVFEINEMVFMRYKNYLVRAIIEDMITNIQRNRCYCWLVDFGILVETDSCFKLDTKLQQIEPLAKQASLKNICFVIENLSLEYGYKVLKMPSIHPSNGLINLCKDLIAKSMELYFNVSEEIDNILIGELEIHRDGKIIELSQELIRRGLALEDQRIYRELRSNSLLYMKTHLSIIKEQCKSKLESHEEYNNKRVVRKEPFESKIKRKSSSEFLQIKSGKLPFEDTLLEQEHDFTLLGNTKHRNVISSINKENTSSIKDENNLNQENNEQTVEPVVNIRKVRQSPLAALLQKIEERKLHQKLNDTNITSSDGEHTDKFVDNEFLNISEKSWMSSGSDLKSLVLNESDENKAMDLVNEEKDLNELDNHSEYSSDNQNFLENEPPIKETATTVEKTYYKKQQYCKIMTGNCQCVHCKMVYEEDDWDMPIEFIKPTIEVEETFVDSGIKIKPPQLLRKDTTLKNVEGPRILSVQYSDIPKLQKKLYTRILVHSLYIPSPVKLFSQINIHKDIYQNLIKLNYDQAKKIQQYSMPALTRNDHVFMIHNSYSGKTMSYLPILCSFIMEKDERYNQLFKLGGGPIVVILCSNSRKCEEIYHYTRAILCSKPIKVNLVTYPGHGKINNIDVLITMPTILSSLILSNAINFKRLCHFVLENGDVILKTHQHLIMKFLEYADKVLDHRHCPKSIQLILCAEHWTQPIEHLLNKLLRVPLVCIGNYLDAAVYGKNEFIMKLVKSTRKEEELKKILADVYRFTKSLIICDKNDIENIDTYLTMKGIEHNVVHELTEDDDILYAEDTWNCSVPGNYNVFVCTDNVFNTVLTITNVSLLIHYSLPSSWSQFNRRYSCLIDNITTPLNTEKSKMKLSSYIFLDENSETQLIRFCQYFKETGLDASFQENLKAYLTSLYERREQNKIEDKIHLCDALKLFGKCESLNCKKRHVLDKDLDYSNKLPKNGLIRFKILKINSTTTCSIKLIEHQDLNGKTIEIYQDFTNDINDIISNMSAFELASKLYLNEMYLFKMDDKYHRCILVDKSNSLLFFIDNGIYKKCLRENLYEIPKELMKIPQQAFEVYFANLIPPFEDKVFSQLSKEKAEFLIASNCPTSVMQGKIHLQLGHHMWLLDVYEERKMYNKNLPIIGFQFTRELVSRQLAVTSEEPLERLYELCKAAGIDLPTYKIEIIKPLPTLNQVEPQWAFLNLDEITEVYFSNGFTPDEFYVKHAKFIKMLTNLEIEINKAIKKPFYPTVKRIEVGRCYLVKDETNDSYCRALIQEINGDDVLVFFVDYGDEIVVPISTLKHITNEMIQQLPFQSIQCSMTGIKAIDSKWNMAAINMMYDKCFEPNSDIFRSLYVKICAKQENRLVAQQKSYSVIIKDSQSIYNQLLIDCGFAQSNGQVIKDFDIPKRLDSSDEEDVQDNELVVATNNFLMNPVFNSEDIEEFDLEVFLEDLKLQSNNNNETSRDDNTKQLIPKQSDISNNNFLMPMSVSASVDHLTPNALWSQTSTHVKLTILIADVQDYTVKIIRNTIFDFSTEKNGQKFKLNLILYGKVERTFQHTAFGQQVRITFKKCTDREWPRLLNSKKKMTKIVYDISTIPEVDESKKKFLQLDISDTESDHDEKVTYYDISDIDSDYDDDIADAYLYNKFS